MIRKTLATAALAAIAVPAAAQEDWHPVSPDNTWSITDSTCQIDGGWEGDIRMVINRHLDHHDLGIYDNAIKRLVPGKVVTLRFGTGGDPTGAREYPALGHNVDGQLSYVSEADDELLDRIAADGSFQVWRGKALIEDLDMTGFAEALAAARACEAVTPAPDDEGLADTMTVAEADADAAAATLDALAAARGAN